MPPTSSPLPPLPTTGYNPSHLPLAARRILHSISTITSPSQLLSLIPHILSNLHPILPSTFFLTSILSFRSLSPALLLLSLLPFPPHPFPSNSLLYALSFSNFSNPFPLFNQLLLHGLSPNRFTFPPLLSHLSRSSPTNPLPPSAGISLHPLILKSGLLSDPYISNSLLHFYSSCRHLHSCEKLFDEMPHRGAVAWTNLIQTYNKLGRLDDALFAFERMQYSGVKPNRVTMVCALVACAARGALDMGVWIHGFVKRSGWKLDVVLGTALVDMYGKCGRIDEGVHVFLSMEERNVYTWNALIGGFVRAKCGEEAVRWFSKMEEEEEEEEGVRPDAVTLIEVLRACSHSGLVEMGRRVFDLIVRGKYGFHPGIKHYGCMVDLLGRAGFLEDALELVEGMPFQPSVVIWGSLLGGCRTHGDLWLSEIAGKRLVELEPENVAHYVVLSNLYVEMGRWRDAEEVRRVMKERGMRKDAGWSSTETAVIEYCVEEASL